MPTVDGFCWALEQYVGYREKPPGSNNVPGITDRCGCNASWCAWCYMTISVAYSDAGGNLNEWSVPRGMQQALKNLPPGFQFIDDPYAGQRGDFMIIAWGGRGRGKPDHVEGVVGVLGRGDYHTIGGNVADRCDDWHRNNPNVILGFVRPPYNDVDPPPSVSPLASSPPVPVRLYVATNFNRGRQGHMFHPFDKNRADDFWIGPNNEIRHRWYQGGDWRGGDEGEVIGNGKGRDVSAAWRPDGKQLRLVVTGTDWHRHDNIYFPDRDVPGGSPWTGWHRLPGGEVFH